MARSARLDLVDGMAAWLRAVKAGRTRGWPAGVAVVGRGDVSLHALFRSPANPYPTSRLDKPIERLWAFGRPDTFAPTSTTQAGDSVFDLNPRVRANSA